MVHATLEIRPEWLSKLSPRRSFPGSARPMRESAIPRALDVIARSVAKSGYGYDYGRIFARGLERLEGEPRRASAEALALVRAPSVSRLKDAEPGVLAIALHMARRVDQLALLPVIVAARGVEDALSIAILAGALAPTADDGGWVTAIWIVPSTARTHELGFGAFTPLRHAVCASDAETYARLVRSAAQHRERLSDDEATALRRRAYLAYCFPDEPWADEDLRACHAMPSAPWPAGPPDLSVLLSAATDADAIREEIRRRGDEVAAAHAMDLAHALPEDAALALLAEVLGRLVDAARRPRLKTPPRDVAAAIASLASDAADAVLGRFEREPLLAPMLRDHFRARAGASAIAAEPAPTASSHRRVSSLALFDERPWRALAAKTRVAPLVVPEVLGLDEARVDGSIEMPDEVAPVRDMTEAELAAWRTQTDRALASGAYACADYELVRGKPPRGGGAAKFEYLRVPPAAALDAYNRGASLRGSAMRMVGLHGLDATPALVGRDWLSSLGWYGGSLDEFRAAKKLLTPRVASRMARVAARRKAFRREALAWLERSPRIAAFGLIPDAVGPKGEARTDAESALRHLVGAGHAEAIRDVAARYGDDVARAIDALVARDPLALDAKPPKPPSFLDVERLPELRLACGDPLAGDSRSSLAEMLQVAPVDAQYAGFDRAREACDPRSLEAFALALAEQWVLADAPLRHEWMLFSITRFPSDAGVRRVGALAREWSRSKGDKARRACVALATLGTDAALMHLAHVAETTRFDAVRREATELLREAAGARGLSVDELEDRTVPDVGLRADGTARFVLGEKTLVARLDAELRPHLFDGQAPVRAFPRGASEERDRWQRLKKDLAEVADRLLRRLERAMCSARAWSLGDFRALVLGHPLVALVARRLVWWSDAGLFRVAEDGTFADGRDRAIAIDAPTVRLAHPASDPALATWSEVLADYEILQPFEQVGRAVHRIRAEEVDATTLERIGAIVLPARKALGLFESRGYRRDAAGFVAAYLREARVRGGGSVDVRVPLSPGIEMDLLDTATTIGPPTLSGDQRFGALDAVSFSELVRDLEAARGAG
ncbi:MAG: DUF4132 domain-containing protein [Polyangiaceae bacterium]